MNKLGAFLIKFSVDYVVKYITENKPLVIEKANKKLDVPILNEKQEAEILEICYDISLDMIKGMADKK